MLTKLYPFIQRLVARSQDGVVALSAAQFDYVVSGDCKFLLTREIADFQRQEGNQWFRNVRKSDVCLDIGACVGAITIPLAYETAEVYAVEPLFHGDLRANVSLNKIKNVTIMEYGLGSTRTRQRLAFSGREAYADMMTFAEICEAVGKPIDWLKVDVEGAEWAHLKPEECEGIRELRIEFHVRRHHRDEDMGRIEEWEDWMRKRNYDVIEEQGIVLSKVSPFWWCYSLNGSRKDD